jgi:hypothetical protein
MKIFSPISRGVATLVLAFGSLTVQAVDQPAVLGAEVTKRLPYSMAGQLVFRSGSSYYQGSGTVVYTRSLLTAAHNLWDPVNGWSTEVRFNRARTATGSASREQPSRMYVFGSYRTAAARYGQDSVRSFASDLGGLRFNAMPASGMYAGWRADTRLVGAGAPVLCLGYGGQFHSGDELLVVRTSAGFWPVNGAFMESTAVMFESGMSGGPILSEVAPDDLRVVGIVVAGSDDPPAGGIHVLDAEAASFINTYLRY